MWTLPKQGRVEALVDAPVDAVWNLVIDVTRTGDWSHETMSAMWLDGATRAVPGARFKGVNKQGRTKWSRTCEVLACEPHEFRFRTVPSRLYNDSTEWTFNVTAEGTKTRIEQRFQVLKIGPFLDRLFYAVVPAHRDRSIALQADLERLGVAAAKGAALS